MIENISTLIIQVGVLLGCIELVFYILSRSAGEPKTGSHIGDFLIYKVLAASMGSVLFFAVWELGGVIKDLDKETCILVVLGVIVAGLFIVLNYKWYKKLKMKYSPSYRREYGVKCKEKKK